MERQGIMKALTAPMQQLGEFEEILRKIRTNRGVLQVSGCIDPQKPHFISCAAEGYDCRLIITYSDLRARELYENYRFFDRDVLYFPAKDLIFFQADIHSNLLEQQRIAVLKALAEKCDGHHDDGCVYEPSDAVRNLAEAGADVRTGRCARHGSDEKHTGTAWL